MKLATFMNNYIKPQTLSIFREKKACNNALENLITFTGKNETYVSISSNIIMWFQTYAEDRIENMCFCFCL